MKDYLKKISSMCMVIVMMLTITPNIALITANADGITTVVSENFEASNFTLESNPDNNVRELKKGSDTVLTFVKKPGATFGSGFPASASDLIITDTTTNTPVNPTMAVHTGSTGVLNKDTQMYYNFPETYTNGIVTVEFRTRRLTASKTNYFTFHSDPITGYKNDSLEKSDGDAALQFEYFVNSSSTSRFRSRKSYSDPQTMSSGGYIDDKSAKGWPWLRFVFNLGTGKVSIYKKTAEADSYSAMYEEQNFFANGSGTAENPYYIRKALSGFTLAGDSYATIDDINITYEETATPPVASNVAISGAMTVGTELVGSYDYTDSEGDEEAGSIVTWRRCPDNEFTTDVETIKSESITNASALRYTLTESDVGYYIDFSVLPKNASEESSEGIRVDVRGTEPVRFPKTSPTVVVTTLEDNDYIPVGIPTTIEADATCDNTSITRLELYVDDELLLTDNEAPYEFEVTFPATGTSDVYVKGYNALGESESSEVYSVIITPVTDVTIIADGIEELSTAIFGKNNLSLSAAVDNASEDDISVTGILALYSENNELLGVATSDTTNISAGSTANVSANLTLTADMIDNTVLAKAFVWDIDNCNPLVKAKEYTIIPDTSGLSNMDIYIVMGQSNASGRASIPSDCKPALDNVYLFNRENEWVASTNSFNRFNTLSEPSYKYNDKMNYGYPFAKMITQYVPGKKIGIICNAIGGTSLTQWSKNGTADYYELTMQRAKAAQAYGNIKGILWHLGSSDMNKGYTRDQYISMLNTFATDIRTDLGDMTIPFIAGELTQTAENRIAFNEILSSIADGNINVSRSFCVSSDGVDSSDGSHFTTSGTKLMGRRYADAILNMNYGIDVPDEIVDNISYASSDSNLALSATVTCSSSSSEATHNINDIKDGSTSTYWTSGTPSEGSEDMEYCILDLGDEYTIEEIQLFSRVNYDNSAERRNYNVMVSNDPAFNVYKLFGTRGSTTIPYKGSFEYFSTDTTKYRYVKIEKTEAEVLGLSEVAVFGH